MDFKSFYTTWYSRVKNFAFEYVLCEEDAENITQDVFADFYQKRILNDDQINFVAYLFTSVKNRCVDHLRRKLLEQEAKKNLQKDFDLSLRMKYDSLEAFDMNWKSEQQIEFLIKKALDTLPERCREIIVKSKIEGKKQKEIAEELGISIKTVENQITIGYKKMKDALKTCLPLFCFLFPF
ncbi:MAG: RNA polymerase sigma-70 factor [Massilibacteroides sp.]|nr:RNA polymerase sigma-70 factor [Massilibacteroides sp.]MDD3062702.1 RNA polymerase sigma-70 factor [Massilibacteroides sp.]MDD4115854.1 RNA polymerase sigma-70 factor [Massilibacteroides sp.]MDD4660195.1 RNA polymerase sigma-70 factor [Massilibacteroides sp.]